MKLFFRFVLAVCALAIILIPLHWLTFGQREATLRMSWLLSDEPLYRVESVGGRLWAIPNKLAIATDQINPKKFPIEKAGRTYRIFCIGQSTTEGYPFAPRGGYPEWLGKLLKDVLPRKQTEVINAGACGSDSARDLAIVKEVLGYHPDLLVLYEGNNEAYLGQMRLLQERVGNRLGLIIFWLRSYFPIIQEINAHKVESQEQVASETMLLFQRNILKMIRLAKSHGIPIVFVSQVSWPTLTNPPDLHNEFLKSLHSPDVLYVDAVRAFKRQNAYLLDSVHPSLHGQWLIALILAHGLAKRGWIAPMTDWHWSRLRPEAVYKGELGLTNDFLAQAFFTEAWSPQTDARGLSLVPYDIAQSDRFKKGGIPGMLRKSYKWTGPPSPFLKNTILSYYKKNNLVAAKEFEQVLADGRAGKLNNP